MTTAEDDRQHLELLAIFHYIVGGVAALFSLLPIFHLFFGWTMITRGFDGRRGDPMEVALGWLFLAFATAAIVLGLAFAACLVVAGRSLARTRNYTFCLVVACLACLFMPFGTVLGILTILVLMRPSVRTAFGHPLSPPSPPSPPPSAAAG